MLVLSLWAQDAGAIVNTQPLFSEVTTQAPYAVTGRAGLDVQRGNTRLLLLSASLAGRAKWDAHEFLLSGAHERSNASGTTLSNRTFGHLRYRYWLEGRIQWELYGQVSQDEFQLIAIRSVAGTGPRFMPFKNTVFEWTVGGNYMYEVERVENSIDFPNGVTRKTHRVNFHSRARLDYKALTLRQVLYLQPSLIDPINNIRLLHELDCAVEVFEHFSLTWTFFQSWDSIAPSDVVPYFTRLYSGIKFDF